MKHYLSYSIIVTSSILLFSCNESVLQQQNAPIVLGDSSTIVTETDAKYLVDRINNDDIVKVNSQPEIKIDTVSNIDTKKVIAIADTSKTLQNKNDQNVIVFEKGKTIPINKEANLILAGIKDNQVVTNGNSNTVTDWQVLKKIIIDKEVSKLSISTISNIAFYLKTDYGEMHLKALGTVADKEVNVKYSNIKGGHQFSMMPSANKPVLDKNKLKNALQKLYSDAQLNKKDKSKLKSQIDAIKDGNDKNIIYKVSKMELNIKGQINSSKQTINEKILFQK